MKKVLAFMLIMMMLLTAAVSAHAEEHIGISAPLAAEDITDVISESGREGVAKQEYGYDEAEAGTEGSDSEQDTAEPVQPDPEWNEFVWSLESMLTENAMNFPETVTINLAEDTVINEGMEIESLSNTGNIVNEIIAADNIQEAEQLAADSGFDVTAASETQLTITYAACTKRLIIETDSLETYMEAKDTAHYGNFYVLQFSTEEETIAAYNYYCSSLGNDCVCYDIPLTEENNSCTAGFSNSITTLEDNDYSDWGSELMGLDTFRDAINASSKQYEQITVAVIEVAGFNRTRLNEIFDNRVLEGRNYYYNGSGSNYDEYDSDYEETDSHGTCVSSTVLKSTPDNVKVLPIKILSVLAVPPALEYCIEQGADIVNMSYYSGSNIALKGLYDAAFEVAEQATSSKMIIFASSGNENEEIEEYPGSSPYTISVAAIQETSDSGYERWVSSNNPGKGSTYNDTVNYCAPGNNIMAYNGLKWGEWYGTSFSSPYLASAAAMIKTLDPDCTRSDVISIFDEYVVDLGTEGWDKYYGKGYVNLKPYVETLRVNGITLNRSSVTVAAGRAYQIYESISPSTVIDDVVYWSSEDEGIASVSSSGMITGNSYGKTTITATTEDGGYSASCTVSVRYSDVDEVSQSYFKPVYWMAYNGITYGINGNSEYDPLSGCTRGQMAMFLWRLAGKPKISGISNPFSDVNSTDYYYRAVLWIYGNGIASGYSDGTFKPDSNCSRASAAIMMYRFAGSPAVIVDNADLPFTDISSLSSGFRRAIVWCEKNGVMKGYSDGTFKPDEDLLRFQAAIVLFRYARSEIKSWTCNACGLTYSNESDMESHRMNVGISHYPDNLWNADKTVFYPTKISYSYPVNVSEKIELTDYYYGFLPWGLR